jgi:hypothetical protein
VEESVLIILEKATPDNGRTIKQVESMIWKKLFLEKATPDNGRTIKPVESMIWKKQFQSF